MVLGKKVLRSLVGVVSVAAMLASPLVASADPVQEGADASQGAQASAGLPSGDSASAPASQSGDGSAQAQASQPGAKQAPVAQPDAEPAPASAPQLAEPKGAVSHKPALARMLAYNSKVDTWTDEIRMDFVVRVAHGDVDVNRVPLGGLDGDGVTGMQVFYSWNLAGSGESFERAVYMNTLGAGFDSTAGRQSAAEQWAGNQDCRYTVQGVKTSADGRYDYLTVSLEGDVDYPDFAGEYQIGGAAHQQKVYVVVSGQNGAGKVNQCGGTGSCTVGSSDGLFNPSYATNVADGYSIQGYNPWCQAGGKKDPAKCSGPVAHVGFDNSASLWSGGQANWGLRTDNGFTSNQAAGVAPAKSFFAAWGNPGNDDKSNPCGRTSTFYYEWLGLKDGKWVPVKAVTSKALASNGQHPRTTGDAVDVSYNAPNANTEMTVMGDGDAQNPDGSIDFAKAKAEQGLDGYFKLVSWPTSTDQNGNINGCIAENKQGGNGMTMRQVYNPLYGNEDGVTEAMAANDPAKADELIKEGWTLDTAFDGFDFNESAPAETAPKAFKVQSRHTKVSGLPKEDHKPAIAQMLAYNKRVDTQNDELRADFVLRVGHGDVNPNCIGPVGGSNPGNDIKNPGNYGRDSIGECGLQLFYDYGGGTVRSASYVNTLGSDNLGENSDLNLKDAAYWWARNQDAMYTIRGIQPDDSGNYDYLTVSLEGDVNYDDAVSKSALGGTRRTLHVYAAVNDPAAGHSPVKVSDFWWWADANPVGDGHDIDAKEALKRLGALDSNYWNDVTKDDYPQYVYSGSACGAKSRAEDCNGPIAAVGWDHATTLGDADPSRTWSERQSNWGLGMDHGLATQGTAPGTAPAGSFFVDWYNPSYDGGRLKNDRSGSRTAEYYFQWVGLDNNGRWVPVNDLTPAAQKGSINPNNGGEDDASLAQYNEPKGLMATSGDGLAPAQNPDGSIDFAKAKADQPNLDGYFKLVTWPVSTNGDGSQSQAGLNSGEAGDVYNPLLGHDSGVTLNMALRNQSAAQALLGKGWDVATAYQGYRYRTIESGNTDTKPTPKRYHITYTTEGGVPVTAPYYADEGSKVKLPLTPHKAGYVFGGWFWNGKPFDFNTEVHSDINLIAQWIEPDVLTGKRLHSGSTVTVDFGKGELGTANEVAAVSVTSAALGKGSIVSHRYDAAAKCWRLTVVRAPKGNQTLSVTVHHPDTVDGPCDDVVTRSVQVD